MAKPTEIEEEPASTEAEHVRDTSVDSDEIEATLTTEEAQDILQFDPFADKGKEKKAEEEKTPKEETPKEETPAATTEKGQTEKKPTADEGKVPIPAEVPAKPTDDSSMALLTQQIAALTDRASTAETALAAMQAQSKPATPGEPQPPNFDFIIPDALVGSLSSDDPVEVKQGIQALVKGVGQTVHRIVMEEVNSIVERERTAMTTSVSNQQQMVNLQQDFYAKFPELNNPALKPVVGNVAQQVMSELGVKEWSSEIRDVVGNRVRALLTVGVAPEPIPEPTPKPPMLTGGTGRPATGPGPSVDALQRDVVETLFG